MPDSSKCQCCGHVSDYLALTCPMCGEASWIPVLEAIEHDLAQPKVNTKRHRKSKHSRSSAPAGSPGNTQEK